ncbi:MAG: hypothetical protein ACPGYV_09195 [Phycisphaeraceae bacterium]
MDMLRHIIDFGYLYQQSGLDTAVYAGMALLGTALFLVRMLLMFVVGGLDGGVEFDVEDIEHGTGFSLISLQSIIGFFMGAGWAGLAARLEWGLDTPISAAIAGGFGFVLMVLSALMMFAALKLKHEVKYEMNDAAGKIGTVYMTIPEKGAGTGQVRVSISGRQMTVDAVSSGEKIDAFTAVRIDEVRGDNVLVVSPTGD